MDKLLDSIIENMKKADSLTDDEELIRFGLEVMIEKLFFICIVAILGLLMNCFFESILFTLSFSIMREYGGGYHAETRKKCIVLSILTLVVSLSIIKLAENFQVLTFPICAVAFISAIYILIKAPIDTPNKRFDEDEVRVYGRKARLLTVILLSVALFLWVLKFNDFAVTVLTGIIVQAYLMLKEQISNYINREKV